MAAALRSGRGTGSRPGAAGRPPIRPWPSVPAPTQVLQPPLITRGTTRARARLAVAGAPSVLALVLGWTVTADLHRSGTHAVPTTTVHAQVTTTVAAPVSPPATGSPPPTTSRPPPSPRPRPSPRHRSTAGAGRDHGKGNGNQGNGNPGNGGGGN